MTDRFPMTGAYAPSATCKHGVHPYECREGCDPHEHRRYYPLYDRIQALTAERDRLRAALQEIADSPFNSYDHRWANNEMYRGPYGTGVVDGHRWCTGVARAALAPRDAVCDHEWCRYVINNAASPLDEPQMSYTPIKCIKCGMSQTDALRDAGEGT